MLYPTVLQCSTVFQCHESAGTPLRTHAGTEALGLQDARTAIRTWSGIMWRHTDKLSRILGIGSGSRSDVSADDCRIRVWACMGLSIRHRVSLLSDGYLMWLIDAYLRWLMLTFVDDIWWLMFLSYQLTVPWQMTVCWRSGYCVGSMYPHAFPFWIHSAPVAWWTYTIGR
jgi:hypothetical protein